MNSNRCGSATGGLGGVNIWGRRNINIQGEEEESGRHRERLSALWGCLTSPKRRLFLPANTTEQHRNRAGPRQVIVLSLTSYLLVSQLLTSIAERGWPDRASGGGNFLFPQSANAGGVASSAFNPAESFGQLFATAATPGGGLSNYTPTSSSASSAGIEYSHHHLPAALSETGWNAVKSGCGSAGNTVGAEMHGWAAAPPASFNGFDNYNSLATGEMFMGHHHHHHHQGYVDVGKAASAASFSYGHHHHNPAVVGVSSAAAAAVAYRNYNLAKGTSAAAAASFGFY